MEKCLPEELWRQILECGIENSRLRYKDLCCISICCKLLHRLSDEDSLWSNLLSSDFPPPQLPISSSAKSTYKIRFEREKLRIRTAHMRAVFRKESQIMELHRKKRDTKTRLIKETHTIRDTANQLSNFHKLRQASVALNVWQPEVVTSRQKQIVEQNVVSVESRLHSLEMELRLCKQQISGLTKAYRNEKQALKKAREELESMKYHPLRDYRLTTSGDKECDKKRKKL
ncbi:F-box family protein [Euphorbia peplus]|nr:F-box family protein [Euphorbia peplus]